MEKSEVVRLQVAPKSWSLREVESCIVSVGCGDMSVALWVETGPSVLSPPAPALVITLTQLLKDISCND